MSVSVCLCVCLSTIISSELHVRCSPNFLCMLPMAVARSSSRGLVMLCTFGFTHNVISRGFSTSPSSAHAALGLATNCAL